MPMRMMNGLDPPIFPELEGYASVKRRGEEGDGRRTLGLARGCTRKG